MFWVFCNCCFVKPGQGKKRHFFMTSCSHILCSSCTKQDAKNCKKCGSSCMIVQCNAQMPDEVKEVFSDISDNIPKLIKMLDYQEGNRSKLMAYYRSNVHKYKSAKAYLYDLQQQLNTMKQKYEACKIALNKQQSNIDVLTKKYQWYKEKYGSTETPSRTPIISQMSSTQLNSTRSKLNPSSTPGRQLSIPMNAANTPMNSYRTNPKNNFLTPESIDSSRKSSNSSGSLSSSSKVTLYGYTPPSKHFELLSLFNREKNL